LWKTRDSVAPASRRCEDLPHRRDAGATRQPGFLQSISSILQCTLDALYRLIDLLGALEADHESIDAAQAEHEAQRLELFLLGLERSFGQDFHAQDPFAGFMHRLGASGDFSGRAVHAA